MRCSKETMLLYAVTDRAWVGEQSFYEQVESALKGGITCLQLREKELDAGEFLKEAQVIGKLCKKYNVTFIINDNVDIALKCGADGVHVGQEDMKASDVRKMIGEDMILGVSAHNVEEAKEAVKNGADYLGVGAVFTTTTKKNVSQMPIDTLREICNSVDVPIVAIGGIKKSNIHMLNGSGVDGVALVSAVFSAENIEDECITLKKLSEEMVNSSK